MPFTSINYGTCTLPEGRLVTKELLEVSLEGVGKLHKTPIFPCGIFQLMDGVNKKEGDPNYDLYKLALQSTALRLYPNYANVEWSVDVNARKADRVNKQAIIDKLSESDYKKVVDWIKNNPKDAYALGLELEEV